MSKVAYGLYNYSMSGDQGIVGVASYASGAIASVSRVGVKSGDTKVFAYQNASGANRIVAAQAAWKNGKSETSLTVYTEELSQTGNLKETKIDGLVNVYAVAAAPTASKRELLYVMDYDSHTLFGLPMDGDTFDTDKIKAYVMKPALNSSGYGVDVVATDDAVYGLFVNATDVWAGNYVNYKIIKLNADLTETGDSKVCTTANAFSLQLYDKRLYVTSVGGKQNYGSTNGANSKIESLPCDFTSTTAVTTHLVGGSSAEEGDFRALSFKADGSEAYILTGRFNTDEKTFDGALYRTTMGKLSAATGQKVTAIQSCEPYPFSEVEGYYWALAYSGDDSVVWVAQGNDIAVYKYNSRKPAIEKKATITVNAMAGNQTGFSLNKFALLGATSGNFVGVKVAPSAAAMKAKKEE